ncbi:MAG: fluoride efflux transporter CrcB [Desulfuromonadia bacterium]
MRTAAIIALFCAGGGVTRYYLSGLVYGVMGRAFPYGTLVVNAAGSFLIGLIMELALRSTLIPDTIRLGLTVGFMGGLTTFSTFSYETITLLEDGRIAIALLNVAASVILCLGATWLGIVTMRSIS